MTDVAARRAALMAELAALPDEDDDPAEVAEAVAEGNAEVAEAVGEAVAEAVEAADHGDPEPVVVIDTPEPESIAVADAIRVQAEADAQVAVIEAQADADVKVMRAAADIEHEHEPDQESITDSVLDAVGLPAEGEPPMPDSAPAKGHWFYRPLFSGRR